MVVCLYRMLLRGISVTTGNYSTVSSDKLVHVGNIMLQEYESAYSIVHAHILKDSVLPRQRRQVKIGCIWFYLVALE